MSIARHVGFAAKVAAWLLVVAALPSNAFAQSADKGPGKAERAAARDAYDKGTASFEHGDYVAALDSFVKANALIPSVQAMYWIAQAQDKLGRTEAAIEAYEAITARADFSKLSEDKAATVRARLAALKSPSAPPSEPAPVAAPPAEPAPVAEPPPPVDTMPAPVVNQPPPPPASSSKDVLPKKNTAELGVMGGLLFVSDSNNLQDGGKSHEGFDWTMQVGVRAAFFPVTVFGIEAEYAHGFGHWGCPRGSHCDPAPDPQGFYPATGGSAAFNVVRGHLIGQLPTSRVVPFALLGAGILHEQSKPTGSDSDFALEAGLGLKVMATKLLVPRLDFRMNMTQKQGGGFTDGVAFHPEVLLGLSFTLGR
ncbi:MAG: tetratricopeptide repeat protein [Myxococcales bacterium]